jgi:predicted ATPase
MTLESRFPEIVTAQPQVVAQHCSEAGLNEKAFGYWLKAGQQAAARSAAMEAVVSLQKGLDLLAALPDRSRFRQEELDLQIALGRAMIATRGSSAPDVGKTYTRARALAEQLDRSEYLVPLLYGHWAYHVTRSEHRLALSLAEQMEEIGEARNDVAALLLGRFLGGITRFFLGEFIAARPIFERCHGLSDPSHRAVYAALVPQDPHATMLAQLALTLTYLGYVDQGRARMNEALSDVRQLGHVYSLVVVLLRACWMEWVTSSPHDAQRHAEEAVALANEHGFQFWLGWGLVYRGWSLAVLGQEQVWAGDRRQCDAWAEGASVDTEPSS